MWGARTLPEYQVIAELLGFGTGVVLWVLLAQLAGRMVRRVPGMLWLVASSLLWNVCGLATIVLLLCGYELRSRGVVLVHATGVVGAAIFPISFLLLWREPGSHNRWQDAASRWLLRIAYVNAIWVSALLYSCLVTSNLFYTRLGMYAVPINASVLLTAGALVLLRNRLGRLSDRLYLGLTLVGLWGSTISIILLDELHLTPWATAALVIAKEQSPFLAVVGALFLFARFRWADVLVKTSLRVVAAVTVGVALCYLGRDILPSLASHWSPFPNSVATGAAVALFAAALLWFPEFDHWLMRATDRFILRRPDYREALRDLWKDLANVDSEPDLIACAEQRTRNILDIDIVRMLARADFDLCESNRDEITDAVWELPCGDPRRTVLGGAELDVAVPVRTRGTITHVIAVASGGCRRSLMNEDLEFLTRVAGLVGSRMEAIASERERLDRQNREALLQRLAAEAELKALRAQINPHFLFNCLNTIADLIVTDPDKAETMTVLLGKVFRRLLSHSDRQVTPVADEIDFLRTYLRIEEVRFGPRLRVRMEIDPEVSNESIPSLILQPVVENAIKHGLAPKTGVGNLTITADRDGGFVRLAVQDDGVGAASTATPGQNGGLGLKIVSERLKTLYNGRAVLDFHTSDRSGSRVTILIPSQQEA